MAEKKYPHPAWIEIDSKQFKKNLSIVKTHIGKTLLCLPVKANAYGHGLCEIGKEAEKAGVDYLAVAHLGEAMALRQTGINIPILVLGAIHEDQIEDLIHHNIEFSLSSKFKADLVAEKCREKQKQCRVHIEVDTGMQRTGMRYETALALFSHVQKLPVFSPVGLYSHLATADHREDPTALKQITSFQALVSEPILQDKPLIKHLANSGGTAFFPTSHFDMVRPSLLCFGYLPPHPPKTLEGIQPCFSLKAKIAYFKVVEKGEGISYGHSHITSKQTRIITIPVGYGDGYSRCLSNKACILLRGKRYPIVGKICMDQFMVDIGEDEAFVGEEVVLIGKQGKEEISLKEIADLCNTIPYEVLCLFNERIPRVYLE